MKHEGDGAASVLPALRIGFFAVMALGALLTAFALLATRGAGQIAGDTPLVVMTAVNGGVAAFLLLVLVPIVRVTLLRPRAAASTGIKASDRLAIGHGAIWMLSLTAMAQGIVSAIWWQRFVVFVPFAACALLAVLLHRPRRT